MFCSYIGRDGNWGRPELRAHGQPHPPNMAVWYPIIALELGLNRNFLARKNPENLQTGLSERPPLSDFIYYDFLCESSKTHQRLNIKFITLQSLRNRNVIDTVIFRSLLAAVLLFSKLNLTGNKQCTPVVGGKYLMLPKSPEFFHVSEFSFENHSFSRLLSCCVDACPQE